MPRIKPNHAPQKGNKGERPVIDIREQLKDIPARLSSVTISGKKIDCIEEFQNKTYGLDEESYKEFEKLCDSILEERTVSAVISRKFLRTKSLDWIFESYRNNVTLEFMEYLEPILTDSIKRYEFTFRILYLDVEAFFEIGNCNVHFFTEEELNLGEQKLINEKPEKENCNRYTFLKQDYLGVPLISSKAYAEYNKAKEIAFKECSISIDALKLCSITTSTPDYKLVFDIDERVSYNSSNTSFAKIETDKDYFLITKSGGKDRYDINEREWQALTTKHLRQFHNFLKKRHNYETELSLLIANSMAMYAESISQINLHKRIVSLFTILESLLLKSEEVVIIDSVSKYLPRIIFQKVEDRKEIISVLKRLYKIRSGVVHHAKTKKFDLNDLRKLQISIVLLLLNLIYKLDSYKTKHSILNEIDENLLKA